MNKEAFDNLTSCDFENDAIKEEIGKVFTALEIHQEFNALRHDLDAYLFAVVEWAFSSGAPMPERKDFGL